MEILLRKSNLCDYQIINQMMCELHKHHVENKPDIYKDIDAFFSEDEYDDMLKANNNHFILLEIDKTCAGVIWYRIDEINNKFMKERSQLWIEGIYIKPEYRGKGLGQMLISEVINIGKEMDVYSIDSMIWEFNHTSKELFSKDFNVRAYIVTHKVV